MKKISKLENTKNTKNNYWRLSEEPDSLVREPWAESMQDGAFV